MTSTSTLLLSSLIGLGAAAVAFGLVEPAAQSVRPGLTASPGKPAGEECLRFLASPPSIDDEDKFKSGMTRWAAVCEQAHAEDPGHPRILLSLARGSSRTRGREASVDLLRQAAALGDRDALRNIYEEHQSFGRSDLSRPPTVGRAEAEASLRKAAELGDPKAMHVLTILLDRGSTVKRDPAEARIWAERLYLRDPPPDVSHAQLGVLLGRLLAGSDKPDERGRGLDLLGELARSGQYGARSELALAIRAEDPARARGLLESTLRSDPGGAVPPLVDMLIKGEGGPADPKRALSILSRVTASDPAGIRAALGQLLLEGRLLPRDVRRATGLIHSLAQWEQGAQLQVMGLLADHPEITIERPDGFLHRGLEGLELGEPGFAAAVARLKLSRHPQFRDEAGGCAIVRKAAASGDASLLNGFPSCGGT